MSKDLIIIKNALSIFVSIVGFFFLMKFSGLESFSELRLLNFVFVFWGINRAIKTNITVNKETLYLQNLSIGAGTSILAVGLTILGLIIYVSFIDEAFLSVLGNSSFWGKNLSLPLVIFALAIEGFASSLTCAFILMQYYKNYKVQNTALV